MNRKIKGQEATEFVLIVVLVFFAALLTTTLFGNKIASFFMTDSSVVKSAKSTPSLVSSADLPKYTPDYETKAASDATLTKIGGYDVIENSDGSLSFQVGGQNVNLSADVVNLQNTVFQTTGSSGAGDLIKEIGYMINKYKADYPGSNVPVEIAFGQGDRGYSDDKLSISYTGSASVNTISLKVGNNLVVLQKDQTCEVIATSCNYQGNYRIEGTINSSNIFNGNVTSSGINYNPHGTYTAQIDNSGIINFNKGVYYQTDNYNIKNGYPSVLYNWNINFNNPSNGFKI